MSVFKSSNICLYHDNSKLAFEVQDVRDIRYGFFDDLDIVNCLLSFQAKSSHLVFVVKINKLLL
jgi:hypothetical protein